MAATVEAEELVAAETGLRSDSGAARARVVDRPDWAKANVATFRRLLGPVLGRLGGGKFPSPLSPVLSKFAAAEMGVLLGWMSTRVLGQYDLLLTEDEDPDDQDLVYYVGPNIAALERRHGFDPQQFRLWIALHELTHRAQFTGVPWMRHHFVSLVDGVVGSMRVDPAHLASVLKRAVDDIRAGRNPLDEGGIAAVFATPEQREKLDSLGAMMSLLEGHGDVIMNRAAQKRVPDADRFHAALHARRAQAGPAARFIQKLLGLEAKMRQYEAGERFMAGVEAAGGPGAIDAAWKSPENLPTKAEIADPEAWLARVGPPPALAS
jgi:coenzyme F420 biosynthesis associated uncharacterized protein